MKASRSGYIKPGHVTRGNVLDDLGLCHKVVTLTVRLPKGTHDALRQIVFDEGDRRVKVSINSLILSGLAKELKARRK